MFRWPSATRRIGDIVVFVTDGITEARTDADVFGNTGIVDTEHDPTRNGGGETVG